MSDGSTARYEGERGDQVVTAGWGLRGAMCVTDKLGGRSEIGSGSARGHAEPKELQWDLAIGDSPADRKGLP